MGKFEDLTGKRFGSLVIISRLPRDKSSKTTWLCKCDCGKEYIAKSQGLTKGITTSCGCGHKRIWTKDDLANKVFGHLTAIEYIGKSDWLCRCDCGKYTNAHASDLINGGRVSCGHLSQIKNIETQTFGELTILELSHVKNSRAYWKCKCSCGTEIMVNGKDLRNGHTRSCGCLDIAHGGSAVENEIKKYISDISVAEDITKEKILDLGDGGSNKEIDIYISSLKIGIEYNGSAFHGTKGSAYKNKPRLYHQAKFLSAKKQGIHLINIFDVDWATNEDKIKMYLKSLFVKNTKVFARKCIIKSIDRKLANEFTDKYHIQGKARLSSINYGLYYNDELVSVMSFGCLRLQKNEVDKYELHRYCVKDGYTIVGGASRLLKAFEREYSPKYLLSFSDNDYFMGGIYKTLNFENAGQSTPRYYWFYKNKEIKREKCQLKHLKIDYPELLQEAYNNGAPNKEDYVMLKLGACKVYRSGNTKWEKYYKN